MVFHLLSAWLYLNYPAFPYTHTMILPCSPPPVSLGSLLLFPLKKVSFFSLLPVHTCKILPPYEQTVQKCWTGKSMRSYLIPLSSYGLPSFDLAIPVFLVIVFLIYTSGLVHKFMHIKEIN